jgi:hypothetical protein
MTTEGRTYNDHDMRNAYEEGRRAARQRTQGSGGFATAFAVIAIIVMVSIMALTYLGISPARLTTSAPIAAPAPQAQPAPRVVPQAPVVQPAPVVVQSVPQGAAPQPIAIPQPAPQAQPDAAPSAKPVVIVLHEGYQQPVVTGSGACQVGKGARRCGK